MPQLDNRTTGVLICAFGVGAFVFGVFGIGVLLLQRLAIGLGSFTATPADPTFVAAMFAMHRIAFVTLTLLAVGGFVLALSGTFLRAESQTARRVAQVTALGGYLLVPGMMVAVYLD